MKPEEQQMLDFLRAMQEICGEHLRFRVQVGEVVLVKDWVQPPSKGKWVVPVTYIRKPINERKGHG